MTITELVVSAFLMAYAMATIGELVYLNTYASTKLTNKVDGQVGASRAIRRIAADIRSARIIGNVFGTSSPPTLPDTGPGSVDPYQASPPSGGWPGAPWPVTPYKLGPQTLILQLPAYYQSPSNPPNPSNAAYPLNGFPLMQQGYAASGPPPLVECVDTVIYQLVADTQPSDGAYQLQVVRFPGNPFPATNSILRASINGPQTVLTGIVGPINPADGTNQPSVFEYLSTPNGTFPNGIPTSIVGVSINLEVQTPPSGAGANVQYAPAHAEAYLRSGPYLRMTNN
jgi:hypothetical protein